MSESHDEIWQQINLSKKPYFMVLCAYTEQYYLSNPTVFKQAVYIHFTRHRNNTELYSLTLSVVGRILVQLNTVYYFGRIPGVDDLREISRVDAKHS